MLGVAAGGVPGEALIAVAMIVAGAMFVRAVIGFGDALLAMPLLTLVIGVRAAVPVMTALSVTVAAVILVRGGRVGVTREAAGLLVGAVPGVLVGVVLLRVLPEEVLAGVLGAAVVLFGLWRLAGGLAPRVSPVGVQLAATAHSRAFPDTSERRPQRGRLAPLAGFAAGAFGSATGAGGPPVVVYGVASGWRPDRFRATLQVYFLGSAAFAAVGYGVAGLWTTTTLGLYLAALPGVLLAAITGSWVAGLVPAARFARLVAMALIGMGAALLVVSLR